MGYDYTTRGWYKLEGPVDLSAVQLAGDQHHWANYAAPSAYARVTGRNRNYVVFATQAMHRGNYYLGTLRAVMAAADRHGPGRGLMTTTGEITYDGKDRFVIARDGGLLTLPTARVYDPYSPWNAVYRWSHYMSRPLEKLLPSDAANLHEKLAGRTSIKGWLDLHAHQATDADAEVIISRIVERVDELRGGIAFLNQYSQPYLLIGQDNVNPADAIEVLAEVTGARPGSYGMLYCAAADEQSQAPVAFEDGRVLVLPEISLGVEGEASLLPANEQAYEGLESGTELLPLRSALDLHGLARTLIQILQGKPIEPDAGWREDESWFPASYLFEAYGLLCFFMTNVFEHWAGWPYAMILYLPGPADPQSLKERISDLVARLKAEGIEVGSAG